MIQCAQQQGGLLALLIKSWIYDPVLRQPRTGLQAAPEVRMRAQDPGYDEGRGAGEVGQGEKTKTGHDT
jgi:hypothetical protein